MPHELTVGELRERLAGLDPDMPVALSGMFTFGASRVAAACAVRSLHPASGAICYRVLAENECPEDETDVRRILCLS